MDNAPAGDPSYDPHGTSRPFRPTHRTHAAVHTPQKRSSYLEIERKQGSVQRPFDKVTEALRQNIQWRIEDHNPLEKLRNLGYGMVALIAGVCVLVLGGSLLSQAFPMKNKEKTVATNYAAATVKQTTTTVTKKITAKSESESSTIGAPATSDDPDTTAATTNDDAQPGMPIVEGISDSTMQLYVNAAQSCNMPWQILAAVGRVETNHGTSGAAGVKSGSNAAGAKGPMQFMQATWNKYGLDANKDGKADIYNQIDAVYSAASYLCTNGANTTKGIDNALWNYNHSDSYVRQVKDTAASYYESAYRAPLPVDAVSDMNISKDHHDYPAADLPVPAGTPVFAVHKGTVRLVKNDMCGWGVELNGTDGVRYTYCHASLIEVSNGTKVDAGTLLLRSGGVPGTNGAGDASGPHLHFEIAVNAQNVCPQNVLQGWMKGTFVSPLDAPSTGCSY